MTGERDLDFPAVPRDRLEEGGWELAEESVETRFRIPTLTVRGATRLFQDAATRAATDEHVDADAQWRFFFATALAFDPPLPPTTTELFVEPSVRAAAKQAFQSDLRERGLTDVRRGPSKRIDHDSGESISLSGFQAVRELHTPEVTVPITGWVGTWYDGRFHVSGGAYPTDALGVLLEVEEPPAVLTRERTEYRAELFELIAAVGTGDRR